MNETSLSSLSPLHSVLFVITLIATIVIFCPCLYPRFYSKSAASSWRIFNCFKILSPHNDNWNAASCSCFWTLMSRPRAVSSDLIFFFFISISLFSSPSVQGAKKGGFFSFGPIHFAIFSSYHPTHSLEFGAKEAKFQAPSQASLQQIYFASIFL